MIIIKPATSIIPITVVIEKVGLKEISAMKTKGHFNTNSSVVDKTGRNWL